MSSYRYYTSCVGIPRSEVDRLCRLVDTSQDITRRTFLKHVDREQLRTIEDELAYARHPRKGLTMAADWAVSYHRGQFGSRRCYYFRHSSIEYLFLPERPTNTFK